MKSVIHEKNNSIFLENGDKCIWKTTFDKLNE